MTSTFPALIFARRAGAFDRVLLATVGIFVILTLTAPGQASASLRFTLDSLLFIAPFFAFSVFLAAGIAATGADQQLAKVLRGRQSTVIFIAATFGALSPFCSVSVIPIVAALLAAGVPLAPVMAFWVGSPLMDPEMFIMTAAIIDLPFALARAVTAMAMGLAAGYATNALAGTVAIAQPLKDKVPLSRLSSVWSACTTFAPDRQTPVVWAFWRRRDRRQRFHKQVLSVGWFLLKWLTLAFVIESLLVALVPAEAIAEKLSGDHWWVIPASVMVGVPTYLNGYAALPAVSALLDMGMSPGAALAFMVAGEVTSVPTAMSVFILVKRTVFAWYLLLGLLGSLIVGFAYQAWSVM